MVNPIRHLARFILVLAIPALFTAPLLAQTPGEVSGVAFSDAETLAWDAEPLADHFNVYRGNVADLAAGNSGLCHGHEIAGTGFGSPSVPESGSALYYLVTAESVADGEGLAGDTSGGMPRTLLAPCSTARPNRVQSRAGFGANEWTRARIELLGIDGYLAEQLDPGSISEMDNTDLSTRLALYDPPADIFDLIARQIVSSVYSRRQLEQRMALFWANHFSTYWEKVATVFELDWFTSCIAQSGPQCDFAFPTKAWAHASLAHHQELETYRDLAFNGNFREMVAASAKSPAMLLYLDGYLNLASSPNENHAREVMELHTMGVNGGYTQADVEELARAFTGWTVCKKETADLADPLAPCITEYWNSEPAGSFTTHFDVAEHDCAEKTLFAGAPEETVIPDTCSAPGDGVNDMEIALDAIVAHPSTAPFISRKILQLLVTDTPTQAMIDTLVAEWNDGGNPLGIGDMREVTRAALTLSELQDLAASGYKVKSPFEHFMSAIRALGGATDGMTAILGNLFGGAPGYMIQSKHLLFYNLVPTGYPEVGDEWIDTTTILIRQNYGMHLALSTNPGFGTDLIVFLNDSGVSTVPGNAGGIVDFLSEVLYGGRLPPSDRQRALDFLLTADDGTPDPNYTDTRIRQTAGIMLGFAQFLVQ